MQTQPSNNQPQLLRSDVSDDDYAEDNRITLMLSTGYPNHRVRRSDMDASFVQEILGDTGVLDLMQSRRQKKRPSEDDRPSKLDVDEMKQQLQEMERREQAYHQQILDLLEFEQSEKANQPSNSQKVRSGSNTSSDPVATMGKGILSDFGWSLDEVLGLIRSTVPPRPSSSSSQLVGSEESGGDLGAVVSRLMVGGNNTPPDESLGLMQPKGQTKKYQGHSVRSGGGSLESRMANRRKRISSLGRGQFSERRRRPLRLRKAPRYPQQSSETGILPATRVPQPSTSNLNPSIPQYEWDMNKDLEIPFSSLMGSAPAAQGILDRFLPESSKNWAVYGQLMTSGAFGPVDNEKKESNPKKNKVVNCTKITTPPFFTCNISPLRPPSISFDNPSDGNTSKLPSEQEEDPYMAALSAFINE